MLKHAQMFCILCRRGYSNMLPTSELKVIKQKRQVHENNTTVNKHNLEEFINEENASSKEFRVNDVNIQMISRNIYNQLFKEQPSVVDCHVIKR